jgi:hypothetical protein
VRARRPRLGAALRGGLAVGSLLLFLLANRDRIYLGAELELTGAGQAPTSLWPTRYADAARFLNIPNLDHLDKDPQLTDFASTMGWSGAIGSAPGGVFDLWTEFRWAYLFALFAIGWGFGCVYCRALSHGGFWMALYALVTALSIYFVMQAVEAFAFRALLLGAVMWLGWRYAIGGGALAPTDGSSPQGTRPALHVLPGSVGTDQHVASRCQQRRTRLLGETRQVVMP